MNKRNLVICCAGDQSLHPNWSGKDREFDLMVVYYGDIPGKWADTADYFLAGKGVKLHLIHHAAQIFSREISQYDSIWLPDDDIDSDTATINRLFKCFNSYPLALAQPSLSCKSYVNHAITAKRRFSFLRYTNFVEVMAPIMKTAIFSRLSDFFMLNETAWGIDFLWAATIEREGLGNIAVIDDVAVTHTRQTNPASGYYKEMNLNPELEYQQLMQKYVLKNEQRVYRRLFKFGNREFIV